MQPMAEGGESRAVSRLELWDEEARVAYDALSDQEIRELVEADPGYYLPRFQTLGLKWPR